ncbi:DUF6417 family protein [Streptomyces sp. NPDC005931]|uniref:DUF6417 family protein n=1 Tax=Streptomyces sp. NPDC005931 TaxID=3364737 RepID=UPI0036D1291E
MDDYEHLDLAAVEFVPVDDTAERLALLTLEEAQDLLRLLVTIAQEEEGPLSWEANRLAKEITARIPSEN